MWNYLKNAKKPIAIYGMGNGADKIIDTLSDYGIKPVGVFASDDLRIKSRIPSNDSAYRFWHFS